MSETAHDTCVRCHGQGWYWRVPDNFNPFLAGGFSTARAMYRVECCRVIEKAAPQTTAESRP